MMFMKDNNKASFRGMTHTAIFVGLGMFLLAFVLPTGDAQARQGFKEGSAIPEHYPNKFDQIGRVDRIATDEVVINDCLFRLSLDVEYHTPTTKHASRTWFKVGKFVGYIINSKREIVSLWLIE
jgi:hypothetical protein